MSVGHVAAATIAALLVAACGTTEKSLRESGQRPLNAAQLADMFATGAFDFRGSEGNMSTVHFHADHTVEVSWQGGGDSGTWRTTDDAVCTIYKEIRGGKEGCARVYRTGPDEYTAFRMDGSLRGTFKPAK